MTEDDEVDARLLAAVTALGARFAGLDIQFRRSAPAEWCRAAIGKPYTAAYDLTLGKVEGVHAHWRVRVIVNKNERAEYRITGYGDTFNEAARQVLQQVPEICQTPGDVSDRPSGYERLLHLRATAGVTLNEESK